MSNCMRDAALRCAAATCDAMRRETMRRVAMQRDNATFAAVSLGETSRRSRCTRPPGRQAGCASAAVRRASAAAAAAGFRSMIHSTDFPTFATRR
nr:hypothetical protein WS70_08815 [Burkholderia mayonis]